MSMGGQGGGGGFAEMMQSMQKGRPGAGAGGGKGKGRGKMKGSGRRKGKKKPQGLEEMMAGLKGEGTAPNSQAFMDKMNANRGGQAGLPQEAQRTAPQGAQDWNAYVDQQMKKNPFQSDPRTGNNMYGGRADSSISGGIMPQGQWQPQAAAKPYVHHTDMKRQAQARPQMSLPSERGNGGGNAILQARKKHRRQAGLGR